MNPKYPRYSRRRVASRRLIQTDLGVVTHDYYYGLLGKVESYWRRSRLTEQVERWNGLTWELSDNAVIRLLFAKAA